MTEKLEVSLRRKVFTEEFGDGLWCEEGWSYGSREGVKGKEVSWGVVDGVSHKHVADSGDDLIVEVLQSLSGTTMDDKGVGDL